MGAIGKLLALAFGRILFWIGTVWSGKILLLGVAVAAFIVLLTGLNVLFNTLLGTISMSMPSEFQWGLGIIPTNIPACMSAIISARAALWVFDVKWSIVKIKMNG